MDVELALRHRARVEDFRKRHRTGLVTLLFTDMIGSTRIKEALGDGQGAAVVQQHRAVVRETLAGFKECEEIETAGDSFFIIFVKPSDAVRFALTLQARLRDFSQAVSQPVRLRIGIHIGEVIIEEHAGGPKPKDLYGIQVDICARLVSLASGDQILLSRWAFDNARQVLKGEALPGVTSLEWLNHGFYGVRGVEEPIEICEVGERGLACLKAPSGTHNAQSGGGENARGTEARSRSVPDSPAVPPGKGLRVAILYKRNAEPDETLLRFLEIHLLQRGVGVFIDRHLAIGVEWAKEIERQVCAADAVIPLMSAASVQSEMLAYEIELAHDAAQHNRGKPRLLPVRLNFAGELPETLARILDPLEYVLWEDASDNDRLVSELVRALESPPKPSRTPLRFEPAGGAVPLTSEFYILRAADEEFREAILRQDSIVLVKGPRQIGKTSLLARGVQHARQAGWKVVLTDFQSLTAKHLQSVERFYLALAEILSRQLDLALAPAELWDHKTDPSIAFESFVRRHILGKLKAPLVWGLDEVDRLFSCDFGSEVFGLIRSWHNARALDPGGPWERLTLAIAYATEAHLFITDANQSPFNVGTRLTLEDFSVEQVAELNGRYGSPIAPAQLGRFCELLGGHPYLVRHGLNELTKRGLSVEQLAQEADRDEGAFGDHLRRILVLLAKDEHLCEVARNLLRGQSTATFDDFYRLRSAGIIAGDSPRNMRFRCALYSAYLKRHLV